MQSKKSSLLLAGALMVTLIFAAALFAGCICPTPITPSGKYSGYDNKVFIDKYSNYTGTLGANERINVDVHNVNGDVKVIEGEGNDFVVTVLSRGTARDHARFSVEFTDKTVSGERTLNLKVDDKESGVSTDSFDWHYSTDMTIVLPKGITYEDVQTNTVNGNVNVGNLTGRHFVTSIVNGNSVSRFNSGNMEFVNVNGNIDISTTQVKGIIIATTVNGNIVVRAPENSSIKVEATSVTSANKVQSDFTINATENTSFRYVGATPDYVAGSGIELKLNLVNGNIQIKKL